MPAITIPEFYIALKLQTVQEKSHSSVDKSIIEAFRLASEQYLLRLLPTLTTSSLTSIKLNFGPAVDHPPKKELAEFDLYWEGDATVEFDDPSDDKDLPTRSSIFQLVLSALGSKEYLLNVIRKVDSTNSPFASAIEVQAKLLKRPTAGGNVQSPAFYMAFVSKSRTMLHPTPAERQAFIDMVQGMAHKKLSDVYADSFESVEIHIVELDFERGLPDERFNIYVELSATARFSYDTPDPMDFFQVLTQSMTANILDDLNALGERCFCQITNMVMRLCVIIEVPILVASPFAGDGEPLIIRIYIHFFIALVIEILQQMPSEKECAVFHNVIQEYFTNMLAAAYPGRFVRLSFPDPQTRLDMGMPAARYNVLHEYNAVLEFYDGGVPDELELLTKVLQCNVLTLTERLLDLTDPWKKFREVTLGKVAEVPVSNETYSGKIDIVEEVEIVPPPKTITKVPKKKRSKPRVANKKSKQKVELPQEVKKEETPEYVIVSTSDVFMSFGLPEDVDDPSPADYDRLAAMTSKYYRKHLRYFFRETFVDIQVSVRKTRRGCDIPSSNYSHYVEWNIEAKFQSTNDKYPTEYALCRSLIGALEQDYLVDYVCRRLKDTTPFGQTMRVYSEQVVDPNAPILAKS